MKKPLIFLCLTLISCSGGARHQINLDDLASRFEQRISIPNIPAIVTQSRVLSPTYKPQLFIEPVKDSRASKTFLSVGDKTVEAQGKIELFVFYALREAFRQQGVAIIDNAPAVLSLSVLKWVASIDQESGAAEAVISVSVAGPDGGELYSRSYDGLSAFDVQTADPPHVQVALGQAMATALSRVASDKELLELVASY